MAKLKSALKWTGITAACLLAVIFLVALDRFSAARNAAPIIDGEMTAGQSLTAPLSIIRDKNAVPHIEAQSEADAAFGLGFSHAQDRLWQMELLRRVGSGRLAEMFGPPALSFDRFFRTLGFAHLADETYTRLPEDMRGILDAYTAGVNAFLQTNEKPLPFEFQLLFHEPEPWQPQHSIIMVKMLGLGLSGNAFDEIARAKLARELSPERFNEFFGTDYEEAPYLVSALSQVIARAPLEQTAAAFPDLGPIGASNNWVVSGEHTRSGKPLLANDPHLGMLAPSLWYLVHLKSPAGNVVGGTIPGIPAVLLGRNDRIAWGLTNTRPDTQDLYLERLNPENENQYETPEGFEAFETREERIRVRFGADEDFTVRATRHGPVLTPEAVPSAANAPEGHVLALAWPGLKPDDMTVMAGYRLTKAQNFEEFLDALREDYVTPMQSIVYGDVEGNIGFIAPAHVPLRSPDHTTKGLMPAAGWKAENDWTGLVPFEALPQLKNPPSGKIASANHKIVDDNYPYQLALDWDAPYRAIRIYDLLNEGSSFTVQDFAAMQMDNYSLFAARILPLLLENLPEETAARPEVQKLKAWDFVLDADRAEPLIYAAFLHELPRLTWADELGPSFQNYTGPRANMLFSIFGKDAPNAHWCNDITNSETETCEEIAGRAMESALAKLRGSYGDDMENWTWGEAHPVVNNHIPGGGLPVIKNWLTLETPSSGGMHTLNRGQYRGSGERPFANIHAAGFRAVYDLNDLDASLYMISTGQSGNPFSPFYSDRLQDWADGKTFRIETERTLYGKEAIGTLRLTPAPVDG
ncbi:penicillin acylase family protein [Tepidicaulis sp. LMO-SS28]|uniref:penicillin acylase family protein n=1 Tax=Tepidicaulis sp. LMO-SS28 TaxID=3447455 RepID=UPI003EDFDEA9